MHIIQHFKLWCGLLVFSWRIAHNRTIVRGCCHVEHELFILLIKEKKNFLVFSFEKTSPCHMQTMWIEVLFKKKNNYICSSAFNGIMLMFNYLFIYIYIYKIDEPVQTSIISLWMCMSIYIIFMRTCCDSHPSFERLLHEDNDVFYI